MLSILQFTDMHIFEDRDKTMFTIDTKKTFRDVCAAARAAVNEFDCILLTGDLTDNAERESYRWLAAELDTFGKPVYAIPGNHDDVDLVTEFFPTEPTLSIGRWQLVMLNSCADGMTGGRMSEDALSHLERSLQANTHDHCLLVLHHQPVAVGSSWMDSMGLENADAFWGIVDQHANANDAIKGVLWGHVHQNFDSYRDGVRLIGSPSTCTQFVPKSNRFALDKKGPGYRRVVLHDDGSIDTTVVRI